MSIAPFSKEESAHPDKVLVGVLRLDRILMDVLLQVPVACRACMEIHGHMRYDCMTMSVRTCNAADSGELCTRVVSRMQDLGLNIDVNDHVASTASS